jgi:hypothetical protein
MNVDGAPSICDILDENHGLVEVFNCWFRMVYSWQPSRVE